MKSYSETAENVIRRRDEYLEKRRKSKRIAVRLVSCAACVCVAAGILVISPWRRSGDEIGGPESSGVQTTWNSEGDLSSAGDESTSADVGEKRESRIVVSYTSSKAGDWIIVPPSVGEVYVFPDLNESRMAFSGQDVKFLVFIDIIDENGWYLLEEEKEAEYARLEALGYESADMFTDITDVDSRKSRAFNLTEEQIANFAASEEYGYLLRFTGEDEENIEGELGLVTCDDGSVCLVILSDGDVAVKKYADRATTGTATLSEDFG